jgi:ATP-dependent exoDNAse (exonuclease V) beta subunit
MTLHHAKGLEFDTVILPGLARSPKGSDRDLLRWRTRPCGLLLAPINARGGDKDPVYSYLELLATAEADHELGRLLYVGVTRARSRLHLIGTAEVAEDVAPGESPWKPPQKNAALAKLWPALALPPPLTTPNLEANAGRRAPPLVRLAAGFTMPKLAGGIVIRAGTPAAASEALIPFEWAHATAAAIGTVTHRLLARLAREGIATWNTERVAALYPRVTMELRSEGVDGEQLAGATADVDRALRSLLADPRGCWLFDPAHGEAASEWALAAVDDGAIVHVSLDRTFVADGVRWIVDFKTGRHEGGDAGEFLDREIERYRDQLERYARIVRGIDPRPIRVALYFPLVEDGWREWAFEDQAPKACIAPTASPRLR